MELATTKCWFIWKESCLRIFEDKSRTPEQLTLDITRHYAYWHPANLDSLTEPQCRIIKPKPYWNFPVINTFKLNCDASWLSENTNAGFGFIFGNWTRTFKGAESGVFRNSTAEVADALTVLQATKWIISKNLQNLVIKGDNQTVMRHLQRKFSTIQWKSLAILEEVKKIADNLVSFLGFHYVDRKDNRVADLLAKKGRKSNIITSWEDQAPSFLIPTITYDTVKAYEICNLNSFPVTVSEGINLTDSIIENTTHSELVTDETEII
ncbi:uncharacterized protein LOC113351195 [Papaver somniferum]|uniref:uncharacterized protein LOC113351195 n=1 Tax=Papaver somniferum TaxID=3469 RepID=UPI000E703455|nr:uncharacterized protein LOC113351195 [Papaver somniferum]